MTSDFTSRLKYGVSAVAVATSLTFGVTPSFAADDEAAAEDVTFEEVVVTGSRIKRKDLTAPSPVAIVGAEEFKLSGTVNVEQVLNSLPQTVPGLTGNSNNPGDGTATVNLRGLGAARTMVLVNGRRYLASSQNGVVDLNTIPSALIKQVEVMTGGASAVYGSDALAGVVNFIMRDDFEGVQFNGQYGLSHKGDGEKWNLEATVGGNFADDRGNIVLHTSYARREAVMQGDRDFSTFALGNACVDPNSQDSNFGNFQPAPLIDPNEPLSAANCSTGVLGGTKQGSSGVPGTRVFGVSGLGRFGPNGEALPWDDVNDRFNYAPDNFLQLPQERFLISSYSHYDISDHVTFYSEATFIHNRVPTELAPTPAFLGSLEVDVDSPFFAADSQAILAALDTDGDGFATLPFIGRRMVENGSRQQRNTRNGFRIVTGFKGDIDDNWSYDAYYTYQRIDYNEKLNNDVSDTRFRHAVKTNLDADGNLQCSDASARAAGCVPMNIFGEGNISQAAVDYVNVGAQNSLFVEQHVAQAAVSGTIGDLGAGDIGIAFGFEYRKDSSNYQPDEFLASGDVLGFNSGEATVGSYDSKELFGEIVVPLISEAPFAEALEFTGALRYSDYSTAGGVWSYAAGLDWTPISDITVRGQYQRAVRAPNVLELFLGNSNGFPGAKDPCTSNHVNSFGGIAALTAICEANGVPTGQTGLFAQANTQIEGIFGGNPNLKEEVSDTFTIGAVIQPEAIDGFALTVDYYNIKIDDAISTLGVGNILRRCITGGNASSADCQKITRRSDGNVDTVLNTNDNIATLKTSGIDVQADYTLDLDSGLFEDSSTLGFNVLATYVIENAFQTDSTSPFINCDGNFGDDCGTPDPKFRFNARVTYASGPMTVALKWTYYGGSKDDTIENGNTNPADIATPELGSAHYFDLTGSYEINENWEVYGGINNIFNRKPEFLADNQQQANTYPNMYDVIGTYFFFGATTKF